jgi:hypothetical protein
MPSWHFVLHTDVGSITQKKSFSISILCTFPEFGPSKIRKKLFRRLALFVAAAALRRRQPGDAVRQRHVVVLEQHQHVASAGADFANLRFYRKYILENFNPTSLVKRMA